MAEERNEKSLCKKSMKIVLNIIKLSSFSIAKSSLGMTGYRSMPTKNLTSARDSNVITDDEQLQPQFCRNPRSEKLQSSSKPHSFMMRPDGGNEEKREGDVDGMFVAYIKKVRAKNRRNFHEASKLSPYILPPPPTPSRNK
ncbi:hypothetical protein V6N13_125158 [Hibiscus sabdariffa]